MNLGIQIPEGRKLFPSLTVMESIEMGAYGCQARENVEANKERVFEFFPILFDEIILRSNQLSRVKHGRTGRIGPNFE